MKPVEQRLPARAHAAVRGVHRGDDGEDEGAPELERRVQQPTGEALLVRRDAGRPGDIQRSEGEAEADAGQEERR